MLTCLALYRGTKLSDLELIALSTDTRIVDRVVKELLACPETSTTDPALATRRAATRSALHIVASEVTPQTKGA
jgi:hypothetical protein